MPVVGLIVTLSPDPAAAESALAWLGKDQRFTLGPVDGLRVAVVLDTPDREADEAAWDDLAAVAGVAHAEPVYADLSDCTTAWEHV